MTMPHLTMTQEQWSDVVKTIEAKSPVFVLGSGCRRIGYDDPGNAGWEEVRARFCRLRDRLKTREEREFLARYYEQLITVESGRSAATDLVEGAGPPQDALLETWRLALAELVLRATRVATQALGKEISAGVAPVVSWDALRVYASPVGSSAAGAGRGSDEVETEDELERLYRHLCDAIDVARIVAQEVTCAEALTDRQVALAHVYGLRPNRHVVSYIDESTAASVRILNPGAIARDLAAVSSAIFTSTSTRIDGAIVEWFSCLLRHILLCDAPVPPSEDELSFELNLLNGKAIDSRIGVGHPGLHAHPPDVNVENVLDAVVPLLEHRQPRGDARDLRRAFSLTIAATLRAQWHDYETRRSVYLPIAIVSDFDLSLEAALRDVSRKYEHFHVLVPVSVQRRTETDQDRSQQPKPQPPIEWLYLTMGGRGSGDRSVKWLLDVEAPDDANRVVKGPLIVKLNGSPLQDGLPNHADEIAVKGGQAGRRFAGTVSPAVVHSEARSLATAVQFLSVDKSSRERGLAEWLAMNGHFTWPGRAWLYCGVGFDDWLARVRLYFNTNWSSDRPVSSDSEGRRHIAFDRDFPWPTHLLLEGFDVRATETDLRNLILYFNRPEVRTREFFKNVRSAFEQEMPVAEAVDLLDPTAAIDHA